MTSRRVLASVTGLLLLAACSNETSNPGTTVPATMAMGFGCNAAGVIATRVIDSPRERLVAILTNNFVPCNGRFPTLIMVATIFVGATVPPAVASLAAAAAVMGVVIIGVMFTLAVSWGLSHTVLKG